LLFHKPGRRFRRAVLYGLPKNAVAAVDHLTGLCRADVGIADFLQQRGGGNPSLDAVFGKLSFGVSHDGILRYVRPATTRE